MVEAMVKRPAERGFALLLALAVLLLVAAALLLAFRTSVRGSSAMQQERRLIELRAASDAALAETMASLEQSSAFSGISRHHFAGGRLSSTVTHRPDHTLRVVATATRNGWGMSLEAIVRVDPQGKPWIVSWKRSPARPTGGGTVSTIP